MLPFQDRYSRQRKLPEIGAEGQRRIEGMSARVASGPGCLIELAYLERAGVGQLEMFVDWSLTHSATATQSPARQAAPAPRAAQFPHVNVFRHSAARDVAAAAWRARGVLMSALQIPQPAAPPKPSPAKSEIGTP